MGFAKQVSNRGQELLKKAAKQFQDIENLAMKSNRHEAQILEFKKNLSGDVTKSFVNNNDETILDNIIPLNKNQPVSPMELTKTFPEEEILKNGPKPLPKGNEPYKFEKELKELLDNRPSLAEVERRMGFSNNNVLPFSHKTKR